MKRERAAAIEAMVEELKGAARALGFEVREEELLREVGYRARSGSCRVKERMVVVLDRHLSAPERVDVLCATLAQHDLEHLFLSPAVRSLLGARRPALAPSG